MTGLHELDDIEFFGVARRTKRRGKLAATLADEQKKLLHELDVATSRRGAAARAAGCRAAVRLLLPVLGALAGESLDGT